MPHKQLQTEKRDAQIEKEVLAIVCSTKRFYQYMYGRPVTVQSDHKLPEVIMRKLLNRRLARLRGMMLQLQRFDLNVTYTPMYVMKPSAEGSNCSRQDVTGCVLET